MEIIDEAPEGPAGCKIRSETTDYSCHGDVFDAARTRTQQRLEVRRRQSSWSPSPHNEALLGANPRHKRGQVRPPRGPGFARRAGGS